MGFVHLKVGGHSRKSNYRASKGEYRQKCDVEVICARFAVDMFPSAFVQTKTLRVLNVQYRNVAWPVLLTWIRLVHTGA